MTLQEYTERLGRLHNQMHLIRRLRATQLEGLISRHQLATRNRHGRVHRSRRPISAQAFYRRRLTSLALKNVQFWKLSGSKMHLKLPRLLLSLLYPSKALLVRSGRGPILNPKPWRRPRINRQSSHNQHQLWAAIPFRPTTAQCKSGEVL
jgi:hypothetical protein